MPNLTIKKYHLYDDPKPARKTYHLVSDGVDDSIVVPASSSLNNLALHDFCIEMSLSTPVFTDGQYVLKKGDPADINDSGLIIYGTINSGMMIYIMLEDEVYPTAKFDIPSAGWHTYEFDWNSTTKEFDVWIDGLDVVTDRISATASPYIPDTGFDMTILGGSFDSDYWSTEGKLRWIVISNIVKHTAPFTPPSLKVCPDDDPNTLLRFDVDEGSGTVLNDTGGKGNDGTIDGATWVED